MKALILRAGAILGALGFGLCASVFGETAVKYSQVEFDVAEVSPQRLAALGLPVDHHEADGAGVLSMPVSQYDLALLRAENIPHRLLIDDVARHIELRNLAAAKAAAPAEALAQPPPVHFKLGTMGGFLTFAEAVRELDSMRIRFPNLISAKIDLGRSRENRPIWAVRISNNPDVEQNKPRIFYDGLIHAREPISMMHLMYFMWHLLENYTVDAALRQCMDNVELLVVPILNPDGYEYNRSTNPAGGGLWRKNRYINPDGSRGVDLNRNFSTFWGDNSGSSGTGSSDTYRGTAAFSEPEAQAIRNARPRGKYVISFNHHSYANRVLTPYGIGGWPANRTDYERIATELTRTTGWQYGPTPLMLGYSVSGALKDWAHEAAGEYGFGAEAGASSDGFWPAQSRIAPLSALVLDMNLSMMRQTCATTHASAPGRNVTPGFHADLHAADGELRLRYRLSDDGRSWRLALYNLRGKALGRIALGFGENTVSLPQSGFSRSLGLVEISACKSGSCESVYRKKLMPGTF